MIYPRTVQHFLFSLHTHIKFTYTHDIPPYRNLGDTFSAVVPFFLSFFLWVVAYIFIVAFVFVLFSYTHLLPWTLDLYRVTLYESDSIIRSIFTPVVRGVGRPSVV